jgi:class 3 adenylate cyclase
MHRLTLAFPDAELERAYLASRRHRFRTWVIGTAASIVATLIGTAIMLRLFPDHRRAFIDVSLLGCLPIMVLGVLVPALVPAERRSRVVGIVAPATSCATMATVIVLMGWVGPPYALIAAFQITGCLYVIYTGVGLRFVHALVLTGLLCAAFFVVLLISAGLSSTVALVVFWTCFSQILAMQQGYAEERSRRRMFLQQRTIDEERAKSERLLRNMLPAEIAERLKRSPGAIADGFDAVTVLFADIAGFTPMSERMTPAEVVRVLNQIFSAFDEIAQRHGLEKIKTIGDAYMVVGGAPAPRRDHAAAVAAMALEMRDVAARFGDGRLTMRIGLHSGAVVAGVIGTSKYTYDLWGDTVNTASRMESHGEPGRIQISDAGRTALGDGWQLDERGVIEVKGKGPMRTWWLNGRAP